MILAISAGGYDKKFKMTAGHRINKREDVVNKHHRDPGKALAPAGKLLPVTDTANSTKLFDVKILEDRPRSFKNDTQHQNHRGHLQVLPTNQLIHRSYNVGSQRLIPRDGRGRSRYHRTRAQRSKQEGIASKLSRWFFADDSEEAPSVRTTKIRPRFSSFSHPPSYQNFPPYWHSSSGGSGGNKFGSYSRFQKSRAIHHRPVTNNKINFVKKECNACNSVPWTPILKPSIPHHQSFDTSQSFGVSSASHQSFDNSQSYGVPTIDVHHDTSAYDTTHQQSIVPPPAPVREHSPDSTIPASYGLPLGNIPTAHGLLPPINQVKINPVGLVPPPPTVLHPVPTEGLLSSIPFPELSPVPVVPLHNSNPFLQVETVDLVPPIPPQKSVSNVVFTISENGPSHANSVIDNHISQSDSHGSDQHSDSSSLVNSHLLTHQIQGAFNHYNPTNNQVNLDIVKSVPIAEYTSSIQYPLQVIQSPQYIDIASLPNITNVETPTYEKESQTGSQKISDILFGLVKDTNSKKHAGDNVSGIKLQQETTLHAQQTQHSNHYLPINVQQVVSGPKNNFVEAGKSFNQQNSVYTQQQNTVTTGRNPPQFVNSQGHQAKLESANGGFPDTSSTSWLIPAQSNLAPQWILPVSNTPSIPYPLLPEEEGIASAVNGELSPTPPPQPMNDPKTKKIQIIIPYTTGDNNKDIDQNYLESEIHKTSIESVPQSPPTTTAPPGTKRNQGRKVPGQQVATFSVPSNATQSTKFINDVHHILAFNIKELLKDEVEKPKAEQNIRLQKNIDNWTALEYSNHKTVAKKEPLDVISYANAVTSIPGTSINHLLLTSKKIPDKYLTTTPLPNFDEPATTQFAAGSGVSVESKPFTTKTYDTSGLYSTVTRIAPTTTLKTIIKDVLSESKNHRNGYTEVVKTKVNQWGKLNENLVLPEKVSNRSSTATWSDKKSTIQDEKVYVVTPVSVWQTSGADSNKRTTRQVFMTEKPEIENGTISPEATKSYISKLFGNKTERAKISKFNKPKPIQKFFATTKAPTRNITKVEIKDIPLSKVEVINEVENISGNTEKKSINDVFPFRNGGELPVELALANKSDDFLVHGSGVRKTAKQSKNKNSKDFRKVKKQNDTEEVYSTTPTIIQSK